MRDPEGQIELFDNYVRRKVRITSPALAFLRMPVAKEKVRVGQLIPYSFVSDQSIESPRLPFVTYPHEWSDAQLRAAGDLTLELARAAFHAGYELKDASPWNVIFDGTVPVLCDLMSFVPIARPQWWAMGQFARNFVYPLALARLRGIHAYEGFTLYRDGPSIEKTRSILGMRRFFSRYWPLLLQLKSGSTEIASTGDNKTPLHPRLFELCKYALGTDAECRPRIRSFWDNYTEERNHYASIDIKTKHTAVGRWLSSCKPSWVLDLGCNTGEFSRLAIEAGAKVIAMDQDHDSISKLFSDCSPSMQLYPVISSLSDLLGGRGFAGEEYPGFIDRVAGKVDCLLMLAVIHHLAILEAIPFSRIAKLAHSLTTRYLIVEFIPATDPMVIALATNRNRVADEFAIEAQQSAFNCYFAARIPHVLLGNGRVLAFLEKLNES